MEQKQECILYSCSTPFHIYTAFLLAKYVYKNCSNILIISGYFDNADIIASKLKEFRIFDYIEVINEKDKDYDYIYNKLTFLKNINLDILHFFTWGTKTNLLLLSFLQPLTKVILTDEGTLTYCALEFAKEHVVNKYYSNFLEDFLSEQIDEIWLYNPILYSSNLNKPIVKMPISMNVSNDDLNTLNYIFSFDPNYKIIDKADIIFVNQNLSAVGYLPLDIEKYLLKLILGFLREENHKILIKKHHFDSNFVHKYATMNYKNVEIIDNNIPFELLLMNLLKRENLNGKIFITYSSSSVFNICSILPNEQYKIFLLFNIIAKIIGYNNYFTNINNICSKLSNVYKYIYSPKSLVEFKKHLYNY